MKVWVLIAALLLAATARAAEQPGVVRIASKNFTEQEILGELVAQLIERHTTLRVERRFGLGGTEICHSGLLSGELDLCVEYTGTGLVNVLRMPPAGGAGATHRRVAGAYRERFDLEWLPPIGFNNTYAIAVRRSEAQARGWSSIGDLAADAGDLRGGFTPEFMERPDGYPGLRRTYGFTLGSAADIDPGLMYTAIASGQVDVICAFATDSRIDEHDLVVLDDDLGFFPPYDAAPVARAGLLERHPEIRDALAALAGTIDDAAMRAMNREVDTLGLEPADVAREWIKSRSGLAPAADEAAGWQRPGLGEFLRDRRGQLGRKLLEHLALTALGTGIATFIGVPLGVLAYRVAPARAPLLALTEIMQTIPSLAMLAFMFALTGMLGLVPAATALVLYALLPIVLNTYTGLRQVPPGAAQAALGLGMSGWQRLRMVELPLAAPVIVAGIRAAAVLTVGVATLSTYIGAGGLGDFIARGLARNDPRLTLLGAVPAAGLAVGISLAIRAVERALGGGRRGR